MSQHGQIKRAQPASGPTRRARAALPLATMRAGMATRALRVRAPDDVFVKGLVEASDGLASIFAERGGELMLVAPFGREAELDELLADLQIEIGARVDEDSASEGRGDRWDKHRQEQ
jgi:hypothetical protein